MTAGYISIELPTKWHYEAMTRFVEDNERSIDPEDFERMMIDIGHIPGGYADRFLFKSDYAPILTSYAQRIANRLHAGRADASWRDIGQNVVLEILSQLRSRGAPSLEAANAPADGRGGPTGASARDGDPEQGIAMSRRSLQRAMLNVRERKHALEREQSKLRATLSEDIAVLSKENASIWHLDRTLTDLALDDARAVALAPEARVIADGEGGSIVVVYPQARSVGTSDERDAALAAEIAERAACADGRLSLRGLSAPDGEVAAREFVLSLVETAGLLEEIDPSTPDRAPWMTRLVDRVRRLGNQLDACADALEGGDLEEARSKANTVESLNLTASWMTSPGTVTLPQRLRDALAQTAPLDGASRSLLVEDLRYLGNRLSSCGLDGVLGNTRLARLAQDAVESHRRSITQGASRGQLAPDRTV